MLQVTADDGLYFLSLMKYTDVSTQRMFPSFSIFKVLMIVNVLGRIYNVMFNRIKISMLFNV